MNEEELFMFLAMNGFLDSNKNKEKTKNVNQVENKEDKKAHILKK